jgi:hypothetical protein
VAAAGARRRLRVARREAKAQIGPMFIAEMLGCTPHLSPLLRKARKLGLATQDDLLRLAVLRGCKHYDLGVLHDFPVQDPGSHLFSDEELAIVLISAGGCGGPQHIRCASQLLSSTGIRPMVVVRLAIMERCVAIVRHIAEAGVQHDVTGRPFWLALLGNLPQCQSVAAGRLPHYSRFMIEPGWAPASRAPRTSRVLEQSRESGFQAKVQVQPGG